MPHNSCYVYNIKFKRNKIMSMEIHTLRAVKITQNIFELRKVNMEIIEVKKIVAILESRKAELEMWM